MIDGCGQLLAQLSCSSLQVSSLLSLELRNIVQATAVPKDPGHMASEVFQQHLQGD